MCRMQFARNIFHTNGIRTLKLPLKDLRHPTEIGKWYNDVKDSIDRRIEKVVFAYARLAYL